MRILITGATGFIGYSLSQELVKRGYKVYGLVRFSAQSKKVPKNVIPVIGDVTDYYSIVKIIENIRPEIVFHLAALTPVSESFHQPIAYTLTNYVGTINILEALRKHGFESLKLFVLAGTTEMYDTNGDIDDSQSFSPRSPYAVSKVAATYYTEYMWHTYKLPTVIAIPTNTYGRAFVGQKHFFIEKVITSTLSGCKEISLGNPNSIRDWMFRDDHVRAYIYIMEAAINNKPIFGQRFYFGTGQGYTTRQTFEIIKRLTGWEGKVFWGVYTRPNESQRIVVNPKKAKRILGWYPQYTLEEGLRKAIEEWKQVLNNSNIES